MPTSYFMSTKEINKVRALRMDGNSLRTISKIVKRCIATVRVNTLDITNTNHRSWKRISQTELMAIRRMRQRGDTLDAIAFAVDRTNTTVYNYTKDIVNGRRRNRIGKVNLKTGVVGKGYVYC